MGHHLQGTEFQSDKYPTTPRGKVPLSTKDPLAQDLLWEYAERRRAVDAEFSADLQAALRLKGYEGAAPPRDAIPSVCDSCFRLLGCEEKSVHRTSLDDWHCQACENLQPRAAKHYVVSGPDLARWSAAVMPLAMEMAAFVMSLADEPFDEPGITCARELESLCEKIRQGRRRMSLP